MIFKKLHKYKIYYLAEDADWIIRRIGIEIQSRLRTHFLDYEIISSLSQLERCDVLHLGSRNVVQLSELKSVRRKVRKIVLTWFHGDVTEKNMIAALMSSLQYIDIINTASCYHRDNLISWGVPPEKIKMIPLGINNKIFYLSDEHAKKEIRKDFGFTDGEIIIGSFQKDGNGWGEGLEPKLIKGPDIFCDVVYELSKLFNVKVLLTGPSRGYVIKRLEASGIPFMHSYLENYEMIVPYYHALDLYLVTSRNEGGPMAVLESFATGTPIVSSKVGMAPDVITDGVNGMLCDIGDIKEYLNKSIQLLKSSQEKMLLKAKNSALEYDWNNIALRYMLELYDS